MSATRHPLGLLLGIALVSNVFTIACAGPTRAVRDDGDGPVRITLVGTNDLHGWLEPRPLPSGPDGAPLVGGIDAFAGYLNILREQRPGEVVLLDAGDLFQGTLVVNFTEGEAVIKAYDVLRYDAVALGNHEFDYGPVGEPVVALTPADDPLGTIKRHIARASFPILTGNVFEKATGRPVQWEGARRSVVIERNGVRIGIIGLSTPMTPTVTLAQNVESLDFRPLLPVTLELAEEVRRQGAQVVVLLMHAGGGCEDVDDPRNTDSCNEASELFELMSELPAGTVDAVVAGHTHQYLAHWVDGVPAIQSGSYGESFGVIEFFVDRDTGKVSRDDTRIWRPVPICRSVYESTGTCRDGKGEVVPPRFLGVEVKPSRDVLDVIRDDLRRVQSLKNEVLGPVLVQPFERSRVAESSLGSFVADIMRATVPDSDVAATNSGGLRSDIGPGRITYGDVFNALPFENRMAVLDVSGEELLEFLRFGVAGKHGIFQVSGVVVEVLAPGAKACRPEDGRLVSARFDDGRAIDPGARYSLVTNDFVAGGGDSMTPVLDRIGSDDIHIRNDLPALREAVVAHFRANPDLAVPPVKPGGRIRFVTPKCD